MRLRIIIGAVFLLMCVSITGVSQKTPAGCSVNPDSRYARKKVLKQLAGLLNSSAPGFKKYEDKGFHVKDEKPQNFFVFDLSDPENKSTEKSGCINFLDQHVYHFAARYIPFSLSHIAVLDGGKLRVFKAINCQNSKDNLDGAIAYVQTLGIRNQDEVIQRLRDYRKYGDYFTVDDLFIRCREIDR